jgi:hypothetical protein
MATSRASRGWNRNVLVKTMRCPSQHRARLDEVPDLEADGAPPLGDLEAGAAQQILHLDGVAGHLGQIEDAAVAGGQGGQGAPGLVGLAVLVGPLQRPAAPGAVPPAAGAQHVPLDERGHPPFEQVTVVLEDLAGLVEVVLAGPGDLVAVGLLGELDGQAIDERVDQTGGSLARHAQRFFSSMSLRKRSNR